ncbi:MAG: hypothetical protein EBR23_02160 [Planctomycetia bacterium]|nr:hypothetical protein [Planctomycetia bacterium]
MCELLGLAFNKPVSPGLSFRGFRHRANRNPHGWGLAAITARKARITKEPIHAARSEIARTIPDRSPLAAPIFIGHVRAASCGEVSLQNTHPFTRRVRGGDFVFAHNGTLDKGRLAARGGGPFTPQGSTDSELAMCQLLSWLEQEDVAADNFPVVEQFLRHMNGAGTLNLIFSDGRHLYCYHDEHGYNGLCWAHRRAPFCRVSLRDEDWTADLDEEKSPGQQGYVIASKRLTDGEPWHEFRHGSLVVFRDGQIVHGG